MEVYRGNAHCLSLDFFSLSLLMNTLTHVPNRFCKSNQMGNYEILRNIMFCIWERWEGMFEHLNIVFRRNIACQNDLTW